MRWLTCLFLVMSLSSAQAQCPAADNCFDAYIFCDLQELDGFNCSTVAPMPPPPVPYPPLCFGTGVQENIHWWGFIGDGRDLTLSFDINMDSCSQGNGLQAGAFIGTRCQRDQIWDCQIGCNTSNFQLSGPTRRGATYYVWVDGCEGDICPYTVTTDRIYETPSLPDSLPLFSQLDSIDGCGVFEMCAPNLDSLDVSYRWYWREFINVIRDNDSCAQFNWANFDPPNGTFTEICLILYLGNPDSEDGVCDSDTICQEFPIAHIKKGFGECDVICHENQPYYWNGFPILSSCISPPCSSRTSNRSGCIDSFKSIILLPPLDTGIRDSILCLDDDVVITEDGRQFSGEVCDELITFSKRILEPCPADLQYCDTSYLLSVSRFKITPEWTFKCKPCNGKITLITNFRYETDCPKFENLYDIDIQIQGVDTGVIYLQGEDSLDFDPIPEITVIAYPRNITKFCMQPDTFLIKIPDDLLPPPRTIIGDSLILIDSFSMDTVVPYSFERDSQLCSHSWFVNSNYGRIITPDPNSTEEIEIEWKNIPFDVTAQVCVNSVTDCASRTDCLDVELKRRTVSTRDFLSSPRMTYIPGRGIYCKTNRELLKVSIYNSQGLTVQQFETVENELHEITLPPGWYAASAISDTGQRVKTITFIH